jgi:hypothetical protein
VTVRTIIVLATAALLATPAAAPAAGNIEVVGDELRVKLPTGAPNGGPNNGATVYPLPDGGAVVGFWGNVHSSQRTTGAGCGSVATSNAGGLPAGIPPGFSRFVAFAATCDLTGVVKLRGELNSPDHPQLWLSTLALPTKITAVTGTDTTTQDTSNTIKTGAAADTIDSGGGGDVIDAGGAQQQGPPPPSGATKDANLNTINAGAGDDTIHLDGRQLGGGGTGRDAVSGGAGVDSVTYELRHGIGFPGQVGVNVSLNDVADDGDPNIQQVGLNTVGEGDNVKADVENVTGTKREDVLTGNGSPNRLEGGEGMDNLKGLGGVDALKAREPPDAGSGLKDTISCGSPLPALPLQTFVGRVFGSTSAGDSLDFDLLDVPPGDCEDLTQGAVREGPNVVVASTARRTAGGRLRLRLRCPRAAGRTCAGTLRLAARRGRSGPKSAFSIRRGRAKPVTVSLPAGSALAAGRLAVRLLAVERGRHGKVTTVAFARVPA